MYELQLFINNLRKSEKGATAVEYGLMVAGIAMVIVATVWLLGGELDTLFNSVITRLSGAGGDGGADV